VVFEFPDPPRPVFAEAALNATADPSAFVNRSFAPLRGEGEVVFPRFFMIAPDPVEPSHRGRILERYAHCCLPIWDAGKKAPVMDFSVDTFPLLISWSVPEVNDAREALFQALEDSCQSPPDDVLFRDSALHQAWTRRHRKNPAMEPFPERILVTVD
jgi:hypothetical protein